MHVKFRFLLGLYLNLLKMLIIKKERCLISSNIIANSGRSTKQFIEVLRDLLF